VFEQFLLRKRVDAVIAVSLELTDNEVSRLLAMGKPVVAYDLAESHVSANGGGLFAQPDDVEGFAAHIGTLLDDPGLRDRLGALGRERVETELNWRRSERALLAAYERALGAG